MQGTRRGTRSRVSRITPWAAGGTKPLCHRGCPDPHLDLIAVDSFLASPGTCDSAPNWASPRSGDSGPHLWTIMTWILCSTPEPHLDMMILDALWASP